jgi:hypothetical protein
VGAQARRGVAVRRHPDGAIVSRATRARADRWTRILTVLAAILIASLVIAHLGDALGVWRSM